MNSKKKKFKKKGLAFYIVADKLNPKYLIMYNHLRPYINPKSAHGHAYN
jgi:hypothetical protein